MTGVTPSTLIVTGADSGHFPNLRVLIGSWLVNMPSLPLAVCDFGLHPEQLQELGKLPGLEVLTSTVPITHPWQGKSLLGQFLSSTARPWDVLMWIDADAFFAHPLPPLQPLLDGYDMILDTHAQSVGEVVHDGNLQTLHLRKDDAFSARELTA